MDPMDPTTAALQHHLAAHAPSSEVLDALLHRDGPAKGSSVHWSQPPTEEVALRLAGDLEHQVEIAQSRTPLSRAVMCQLATSPRSVTRAVLASRKDLPQDLVEVMFEAAAAREDWVVLAALAERVGHERFLTDAGAHPMLTSPRGNSTGALVTIAQQVARAGADAVRAVFAGAAVLLQRRLALMPAAGEADEPSLSLPIDADELATLLESSGCLESWSQWVLHRLRHDRPIPPLAWKYFTGEERNYNVGKHPFVDAPSRTRWTMTSETLRRLLASRNADVVAFAINVATSQEDAHLYAADVAQVALERDSYGLSMLVLHSPAVEHLGPEHVVPLAKLSSPGVDATRLHAWLTVHGPALEPEDLMTVLGRIGRLGVQEWLTGTYGATPTREQLQVERGTPQWKLLEEHRRITGVEEAEVLTLGTSELALASRHLPTLLKAGTPTADAVLDLLGGDLVEVLRIAHGPQPRLADQLGAWIATQVNAHLGPDPQRWALALTMLAASPAVPLSQTLTAVKAIAAPALAPA